MQVCLSLELCILEKEEVFTKILSFFLFLVKKKGHLTRKSGVKGPCCAFLLLDCLFLLFATALFFPFDKPL